MSSDQGEHRISVGSFVMSVMFIIMFSSISKLSQVMIESSTICWARNFALDRARDGLGTGSGPGSGSRSGTGNLHARSQNSVLCCATRPKPLTISFPFLIQSSISCKKHIHQKCIAIKCVVKHEGRLSRPSNWLKSRREIHQISLSQSTDTVISNRPHWRLDLRTINVLRAVTIFFLSW